MAITLTAHQSLATALLRDTLTPREIEIFCHIAMEHTVKAAAYALKVTPDHYRNYRTSVLRKLDLFSDTQLTLFAYMNGVLTVGKLT